MNIFLTALAALAIYEAISVTAAYVMLQVSERQVERNRRNPTPGTAASAESLERQTEALREDLRQRAALGRKIKDLSITIIRRFF